MFHATWRCRFAGLFVLILLTIVAPTANADPKLLSVFTDFEFGTPFGQLLSEFSVDGDDGAATFLPKSDNDRVGSGFFGIGAAYRSGRYSWMVLEGTGRIELSPPASLVEFFAADLGGAQGTIQAFGATGEALLDNPIAVPNQFQRDPIQLNGDILGELIAAIELQSTALTGNQMSVIDDFGFSPGDPPGPIVTPVPIIGPGQTYHEDFDDALGSDGSIVDAPLPQGWLANTDGIERNTGGLRDCRQSAITGESHVGNRMLGSFVRGIASARKEFRHVHVCLNRRTFF